MPTDDVKIAAQRGSLKLGLVTACPPGKNSLNEFGWHVANSLAAKTEVDQLYIYADRTDEGPPDRVEGAESIACWKFNSLANVFTILKTLRKTKPDAVIYNLQFATFGDSKLAGGLGLLTPALSKLFKIPTVVILHNLVENVDMQDAGFASNKYLSKVMDLAGRILTKALLRADYVALTIPRYVEMLQESYGANNVLLAPHGSFEMIEEPSFSKPAGPRKVLAFGKWGTYKTVEILIDAYRLLLERGYADVEIVIAGTDSPNSAGYLDGVKSTCEDLPGVTFPGYIEENDVASLFNSATTTVFPYTSTTGSSGVLHQAGSYGRSAVLPDIGDFAEVIEEEGFTGEYFDPQDAASLADALAKLLDDDSRREAMGQQNFAAAAGIPIAEVMDWHVIHIQRLLAQK